MSHSGGKNTPSKTSGVTSRVTQGMASKLATRPTTDTWPNNSRVSGASARVITDCSRRRERKAPNAEAGPFLRGSDANSSITATKLSQKPG